MNFQDFQKEHSLNKMRETTQYFVDVLYNDALTKKEQILEQALREYCTPKIKGKITKGKIKWRGIILVECNGDFWVEQRGKRITPKYNFLGQELTINK